MPLLKREVHLLCQQWDYIHFFAPIKLRVGFNSPLFEIIMVFNLFDIYVNGSKIVKL